MENDAEKFDEGNRVQIDGIEKYMEERKGGEIVHFVEILKREIQSKTRNKVIQVIKEKEDLVRNTLDRNRCIVIIRSL